MIKSAITVSIVEQARKGPFVFHDDVSEACRIASELGFDAVELFAPSAEAIRALPLADLLRIHNLKLAAVGTGAGMVVQKLHLCDPDSSRRQHAERFIREIMNVGAEYSAPAIIGSMQGKWDDIVDQPTAVEYLRDALQRLGEHAESLGTTLLYEPLNRYETNMANTLQQSIALLKPLATGSVKLLADLFHMNIEEVSIADALRNAGDHIGHVHFVDSNRQAAGQGHIDFAPIAAALASIHFDGYASAEAFPIPDSMTTARKTIETFRRCFQKKL